MLEPLFAVLHIQAGFGEFSKEFGLAGKFLTDSGTNGWSERSEGKQDSGSSAKGKVGDGIITIEAHIGGDTLKRLT